MDFTKLLKHYEAEHGIQVDTSAFAQEILNSIFAFFAAHGEILTHTQLWDIFETLQEQPKPGNPPEIVALMKERAFVNIKRGESTKTASWYSQEGVLLSNREALQIVEFCERANAPDQLPDPVIYPRPEWKNIQINGLSKSKYMNIIGWFSCGVTSAVACKLALERYGIDNVDLYYIEIDTAHPDNERFISECEKWYGKTIKRVRSKKYKDQFEVIESTSFINGPKGAKCTTELKKSVRFKLQRELNNPTQVFGFEYSKKEINRAIRFVQQNENANAVFPLIEQQITKENALAILLSNGIEIPAMYRLGYKNNNCIGCVKGGKAYWNRIRIDFPDVFEKMATLERENGRSCINGQFLDELDPSAGKFDPPLLPDCGNFCEVKYTEIIDPLVDKIFKNPFKINEILNDLF